MFGLSEDFLRLEREGNPIMTAMIGVGQMGRALTAQLTAMPGITPAVIVDHRLERIEKALASAGVLPERYCPVTTVEEAEKAVTAGKIAITQEDEIACKTPQVQVVVDVTGSLEGSARIALNAINNGKHIIMMTVETDVVVGPLLNHKAREKGVIFTGMAGDEPGAIMELYDFARSMGLEVLVLGKGKNNEINYAATPETAREEALSKEMNPRMLASFQDCTKTMVELAAVSNATGFLPDCMGAHGIAGTVQTLADSYRLCEEGGVLRSYNVVDYVKGVAPGVFAVVTTHDPELQKELKFLSMGEGPNYTLYRPYHLCSMEIPITVGRLMLYGKQSIAPLPGAPYSDVVAFAKRDLNRGEELDGIGGYTVYGVIVASERCKELNALPVGLCNPGTRLKRNVKKGEILSYSDVELDESSLLVQLRREQDRLIGEGKL